MKFLFLLGSADIGFWLAELSHPYWHFTERNAEMEFASLAGGRVKRDRASDPYSVGSWEAKDLVRKGFLSDATLVSRLDDTIALKDVQPEAYDAVHVVGGCGAAVSLYPNAEVARILEDFWSANKVVGAICHGSIALANNPERVVGRRATGFSRQKESEPEKLYSADFIPNFPCGAEGRFASSSTASS